MNRMKRRMGRLLNFVIIVLGFLFIISGIVLKKCLVAQTVFLSIGTSLVASGIVSLLGSEYLAENERIKSLIKRWQINGLYKTKAEMNEKESNAALEQCRENIDIIAEGMYNFLSLKGPILRDKLKQGVKLRIISCDNLAMIEQRAKDESLTGKKSNVNVAGQILELVNWVDETRKLIKHCNIEIRFHSSYPAYSYLKIDSQVFVSPNLWLRPSQQSFAVSFHQEGVGGKYFCDYFEELWCGEFVHEACGLK